MQKRFKLIGPPGTGKTTRLLQLLEEELQVVPVERCAFVSFTKRGTYEGVTRAKEKFSLKNAQLRYFRTLHSMCFHELNVKKSTVMAAKDYSKLAKALSMSFKGVTTYELAQSPDEKYIFACNLYYNNKEMFNSYIEDINYEKLLFVAKNLKKYKEKYGKIDFTDMLLEYLRKGEPLDVDVAFVDEAQDLTTLQWDVMEKMFSKAKRLYIAGDDDQAIYEWAGADVRRFIDCQGEQSILQQSHRLPVEVYSYADTILRHMNTRIAKEFYPREDNGIFDTISSWNQVGDSIHGPTLILARNRAVLADAEAYLRGAGIVYSYNGEVSMNPKAFRAIQLYERWRTGKADASEERLLHLYKDFFGTLESRQLLWYEAFYDPAQASYYRALIGNGATPDTKPTVELSTIHAAKGSECDHVILSLDYSKAVQKTYEHDADTELRCLYVGATRAKHQLTIKLREKPQGYPEIFI